MNKQDLIDRVAAKNDISKAKASELVSSVIDTITAGLEESGEVVLIGFGTLRVKTRAAREGRNPQTGKAIQLPEKSFVAFKQGKALAQAVA